MHIEGGAWVPTGGPNVAAAAQHLSRFVAFKENWLK